jgi:hypothetical protein
MEEIKCIKVSGLDFNPKKMGDFIYYEGPLLSHFQDITKPNEHYFYRWVDNNNEVNRWLIFKTSKENLLKFFNGVFTELDLIRTNNVVTFLDLDNNLNKRGIYLSSFEDIPDVYLPTDETFFDANWYEPYALELKSKLEASFQEESAISQLLSRFQNLEREQKESKKILSEVKHLLETFESNKSINFQPSIKKDKKLYQNFSNREKFSYYN